MPQLSVQTTNRTWWQNFVTKVQRTYLALRTPAAFPINIIQLRDGLLVDLKNNRLVVVGDLSLHTTGTMRLSSDQHVILQSGRGIDERGEVEAIWLNPPCDDAGMPFQLPDEFKPEVNHGDSDIR